MRKNTLLIEFPKIGKLNNTLIMTKLEKQAAEMLHRCEIVILASITRDGFPCPVPMSKNMPKDMRKYGLPPEKIR